MNSIEISSDPYLVSKAKMQKLFDDFNMFFTYRDIGKSEIVNHKYKELCEKEERLKKIEDSIASELKQSTSDLKQSNNNAFKFVERGDKEYLKWVTDVVERDKVCQCCGIDKYLEAHHIYGFKNFPTLRVELSNGIALCRWCHRRYHSLYGKNGANPYNMARYMKQFSIR